MDDFFYVGSTALNYWTNRYFNKTFKTRKDTDISTLSEFDSFYNKYHKSCDVVPICTIDIFKYGVFNNDGYYVEDNGIKYATPEYLLITYYMRMIRTSFSGYKYFIDLLKIRELLKIIEIRGYLSDFIDTCKKLDMDIRIIKPINHYIYRCLPYYNTDYIIGGEFALLCHSEKNNKLYKSDFNLDLYMFNTDKRLPNKYGSKIICCKESVPYIEYDGLKIQTIDSIKEKFPDLDIPNYLS